MSPLLLAIDTTHESGSLALLRGMDTVEEFPLRAPDGFAHVLYEHLRSLLDRNSVALEDIECFAAASGPGSFTGVRIGLACVKGLSEALGRPAVAISNLEALASFGTAALRAALLDARRGEIYGAAYDAELRVVVPEVVTSLPAFLGMLPGGEIEFISPDAIALPEDARRVTAPASIAASVGRLAMARFLRGEARDPAALDANYVRRSDAELFWKD